MNRTGYSCLVRDLGLRTPLALLCCGLLAGAGLTLTRAAEQPEQPISLKYKETTVPVAFWTLQIEQQKTAFGKEPPGLKTRVLRGLFKVAEEAQSYPFVWDAAGGKLFIDLNRNDDLSDDPPAVSVFGAGQGPFRTGQFTNVHFLVKTAEGEVPLAADISLYDYGQYGQLRGTIMYRCYWEAEARLGGRDWQVGLVPDLGSQASRPQLLLRPWVSRDVHFANGDGSLSTFARPDKLFVGGQAYAVSAGIVSQDGHAIYQVGFMPVEMPTGELDLRGDFLERVLLTGARCTVLLDNPSGKIRIPTGEYAGLSAVVSGGGRRAESQNAFGNSGIVVKASTAAELTIGGPLTNKVLVTREAGVLNLSYSLVGAGGATYRLSGGQSNPEYRIRQNGKTVASGKFEFG